MYPHMQGALSADKSVSRNTDATSRTFTTRLRVWSGEVVYDVRSAARSRPAGLVALFTRSLEAVTNCRASSVREALATWKLPSSMREPPPAACACEHWAATCITNTQP
ncbi:unnamed protein product [Timema podura]|uniref:Uncharacterized protein n=1 Tax=Timema podura TaxID=61482 RepID=A0ABN7NQN7_TIMPD|nr:unnamed protein product [Timema podura]